MRLLSLLLALLAATSLAARAELPQRIDFGSCIHQDRPQPIWDTIAARKPDLFLLSGDNIYGDTDDIAILRAKYAKLGAQEGYQRLLAISPVLATWDDHDYGVNDGGADFPMKHESQQAFLDFFGVPAESPRRQREGVYDAAIFEGNGKRLQVILLDTRFFRSPLLSGEFEGPGGKKLKGNLPNTEPGVTILGDAQWKWLEEQLRQPADLRLVVSSIQVLPEDHRFEKWANFPLERERLFKLIGQTHASGVIFLSGDRHMAEISRIPAQAETGAGYPLYDITSSGMTHAGGGAVGETNRHRISKTNFQELNFGSVEVKWSEEDPLVRLLVLDVEGREVQAQEFRLSSLRAR